VSSARVRFLNEFDTIPEAIDSISSCMDQASIGFEQPTSVSISDENFGQDFRRQDILQTP
jgi:hypothetical protein